MQSHQAVQPDAAGAALLSARCPNAPCLANTPRDQRGHRSSAASRRTTPATVPPGDRCVVYGFTCGVTGKPGSTGVPPALPGHGGTVPRSSPCTFVDHLVAPSAAVSCRGRGSALLPRSPPVLYAFAPLRQKSRGAAAPARPLITPSSPSLLRPAGGEDQGPLPRSPPLLRPAVGEDPAPLP